MSVTFRSNGVPERFYLELTNSNARAVMQASGLLKFDYFGIGAVAPNALPSILASIEEALASPVILKQYVRQSVHEQALKIKKQHDTNVVKIERGPAILHYGLEESALRRKLARLYILATMVMEAHSALEWD